ncbi:hypothetical protein K270103H11_08470 [Gordonibacter urolithinfaciens]
MDTVSGSTAMPRLAPSSTENITDESATILMRACFLLVVVRVRTAPPRYRAPPLNPIMQDQAATSKAAAKKARVTTPSAPAA